jgi:hypothetical protein
VDGISVILNGGLAGKPRFFGTSLAEILSHATLANSWNGDGTRMVSSGSPWYMFGDQSGFGTRAGVFNSHDYSGSADGIVSHRTILSGY